MWLLVALTMQFASATQGSAEYLQDISAKWQESSLELLVQEEYLANLQCMTFNALRPGFNSPERVTYDSNDVIALSKAVHDASESLLNTDSTRAILTSVYIKRFLFHLLCSLEVTGIMDACFKPHDFSALEAQLKFDVQKCVAKLELRGPLAESWLAAEPFERTKALEQTLNLEGFEYEHLNEGIYLLILPGSPDIGRNLVDGKYRLEFKPSLLLERNNPNLLYYNLFIAYDEFMLTRALYRAKARGSGRIIDLEYEPIVSWDNLKGASGAGYMFIYLNSTGSLSRGFCK